MAKKCPVTSKGPMVGNNVSHANNKTKRRWLPNLQHKRFWLENEKRFVRIRVSTRGIRIIDKYGIEAVLKDIKLRDQISAQ
jgi:large subunit ribosomal protein L28